MLSDLLDEHYWQFYRNECKIVKAGCGMTNIFLAAFVITN